MDNSEELKRLKRLLAETKGEAVALRCMMPVVLGHLAVALSDDPPGWVRDFHATVAAIVDGYLVHAPDGQLRDSAMTTLDHITTAVRLTKID